jgi:hypothetical protein
MYDCPELPLEPPEVQEYCERDEDEIYEDLRDRRMFDETV